MLQPDEDRFVDQPSVVKLPVVPQVLHQSDLAVGEFKLFVFHQCAAGVSVDALLQATLALWQPLLDSTDHVINSVVRNRVLQRPGTEAATVDVVDEVWLNNEAAALALAAQWQAMADDTRLGTWVMPGSTLMLLARERVMFAGREGITH